MPAPTKRQPRQPLAVRRQQILDAALGLIIERGYAAATMEGVAGRAGLAKTVVYNAFVRREALLQALVQHVTDRALEPLLSPLPEESDPSCESVDVVVAWVDRMVRSIVADPETWRFVLMAADGTPPAVQQAVREGREQARARVRELLAPAVAENAQLARLDLDLSAHALLAVCEHLARQLVEDPVTFTPERLMGFAHDFMGPLLSEPARRADRPAVRWTGRA